MVPNVSRGTSFKGVTAYVTHDKREELAAGQAADTAERVGFSRLMNFDDGEARTPAEAAKIMALTVRDRDRLKADAGGKASKATAKTVYHMSLSWAETEKVDEAAMMQAVREALAASSLNVEKGYQTYCVEHTDEKYQHVHVVVNLVHPETGRQANPFGDYAKLQKWARDYDKQRGQVFCHDREAKYAGIDRDRAAVKTRADFNEAAKGGRAAPPPGVTPSARPRTRIPYNVWKAEKEARNQVERAAAGRVSAELKGKGHTLHSRHEAAYQKRQAELQQFRDDRQAGRDAIYAKYASALDAIWKPQPGPKEASPDRAALAQIVRQFDAKRAAFKAREGSTFGRLANAIEVAKARSGTVREAIWLAMNHTERGRFFDHQMRTEQAAQTRQAHNTPPKSPPRPKTAEPKKAQADRVKAMRTAELADYAERQAAAGAAMNARHQFQREGEQGQKDTFKAEAKAAWAQHRQAFAPPLQTEQDNRRQNKASGPARPAPARPAPAKAPPPKAAPDAPQERPADRFGRSRDRKPRQPRAPREGRGQDPASTPTGKAPPEAQIRPVEAAREFRATDTPKAAEATQAADLGQGGPVLPEGDPATWTKAERAATREARIAELQAEREAKANDPARDRGRGMRR